MRASLFILAAASLVSASLLTERQASFPPCAIDCIMKANYGSCAQTDNTCLCNSAPYIAATTECIQKTCTSASDLQSALDSSVALCKAAGVTLTPNTGSATGAATGAASSTHPHTSTASAPPASTSKASSANSNSVSGALLGVAGVAAAVLAL